MKRRGEGISRELDGTGWGAKNAGMSKPALTERPNHKIPDGLARHPGNTCRCPAKLSYAFYQAREAQRLQRACMPQVQAC